MAGVRLWLAIPLVLTACKVREQPPITEAWQDDFDAGIGEVFYATGDGYHVERGALSARGAHNHPLWLRKKLPHDVQIDLDAWSTEPRGDIKIEVIFGGWFNTKSIVARLDEHGSDVVQRTEPKVIANRHYHWRIERRHNALTWYVDDMTTPFLRYEDPRPLESTGHEYFGFNNWETDTWFDNLVITPL
jgi:Farnesoic acid 0-methyl transferase